MGFKEAVCSHCGLSQPQSPDGMCVACRRPMDSSGVNNQSAVERQKISVNSQPTTAARGRSPLFWLIIIGGGLFGVILLLIIILLIVGSYVLNSKVLSESQLELPEVVLREEVVSRIDARIKDLRSALDAEGTGVLGLSPEELNIYINQKIRESGEEGIVYLELKENIIILMLSFPVDSGKKGKFLNLESELEFSVEKHEPYLNIYRLKVGEINVPQNFLEGIGEAFRNEYYKDPNLREVFKNVSNIWIEEGLIYIELITK